MRWHIQWWQIHSQAAAAVWGTNAALCGMALANGGPTKKEAMQASLGFTGAMAVLNLYAGLKSD